MAKQKYELMEKLENLKKEIEVNSIPPLPQQPRERPILLDVLKAIENPLAMAIFGIFLYITAKIIFK